MYNGDMNESSAPADSPRGQTPLLATKLRQPRVRGKLVSRAHLTERLNAGRGPVREERERRQALASKSGSCIRRLAACQKR